MSSIPAGVYSDPPDGYRIPAWPSLYLPWKDPHLDYLYYPTSVWRFTVYWSLAMCAVVYGLTGLVGFLVFARKGRRYATRAIFIPISFLLFGAICTFVNATIIGFTLAAIYSAAYLRMSTWVPFLWSAAHSMPLILFCAKKS